MSGSTGVGLVAGPDLPGAEGVDGRPRVGWGAWKTATPPWFGLVISVVSVASSSISDLS